MAMCYLHMVLVSLLCAYEPLMMSNRYGKIAEPGGNGNFVSNIFSELLDRADNGEFLSLMGIISYPVLYICH